MTASRRGQSRGAALRGVNERRLEKEKQERCSAASTAKGEDLWEEDWEGRGRLFWRQKLTRCCAGSKGSERGLAAGFMKWRAGVTVLQC